MLGSIVKRKLDANRLANVFVNSINEVVENGFSVVAEMINEDNAFQQSPGIDKKFENAFLMIVLAGNLRFLDQHFDKAEEIAIRNRTVEKFAHIFEINPNDFESIINDYDSFISRVNNPSKNTLYGMSKAIFHKFGLNEFQEEYFKSLNTPNPLFLKRMDEVLMNFLWDWDQFFKKHKLNFG